ncbi:hypothetical protein FGG08_003924 [Glutinoglossum americanum]|uniref:DUF676 domain-containing protein n=1 Tax=Glutinoglossum americanum TaxID=1670608 RepID=A0A9P8I665_9PEZI|nr:hypothetical protein FGG08_003924 [Glutinoglossum americanum]
MFRQSAEAGNGSAAARPTLRSLTFRVENIPRGWTKGQLWGCFRPKDRPRIEIKSLVPAIDNIDGRGEQTATLLFNPPSDEPTSGPGVIDDTISVDSGFIGFTPLYVPTGPVAADVIAVTGLAAHAIGSWSHSRDRMWLRDYLPKDIPNVRVITYGYLSQLQGSMSRNILSNFSNDLTERMLGLQKSTKDRPIIFIGHSLGCLIIKKVVSDINGARDGFYPSRLPVQLAVFMGAPHRGLDTAALETVVGSKPTGDLIRELKAESPTLRELNEKFLRVATEFDILTCFETEPTKTVIEKPDGSWKREGDPAMMVPPESALLYFQREKRVSSQTDHSQIAKLRRSEAGIYHQVISAIRMAAPRKQNSYSPPAVLETLGQTPEEQLALPGQVQEGNAQGYKGNDYRCNFCDSGSHQTRDHVCFTDKPLDIGRSPTSSSSASGSTNPINRSPKSFFSVLASVSGISSINSGFGGGVPTPEGKSARTGEKKTQEPRRGVMLGQAGNAFRLAWFRFTDAMSVWIFGAGLSE